MDERRQPPGHARVSAGTTAGTRVPHCAVIPSPAPRRPGPPSVQRLGNRPVACRARRLYLTDNRQHVRREGVRRGPVRCGALHLGLVQIGGIAQRRGSEPLLGMLK
jgi:hypothetical protein